VQNYRPIEILVVDNGSIDGTHAIVARYGEEIRQLNEPSSGPAAARNLGLRAAEGEFVAFLDQDDLWHREKLERQMSRFLTRPELDLCITHVGVFWIQELAREAARYAGHRRAGLLPGYTFGALLARRTLFARVGELNANLWFGDATEWFLRAIEQQAVMELLPDVLAYHRIHHGNLTRRLATASKDEFLHIVKASLDRRRQLGSRDAPEPSRIAVPPHAP